MILRQFLVTSTLLLALGGCASLSSRNATPPTLLVETSPACATSSGAGASMKAVVPPLPEGRACTEAVDGMKDALVRLGYSVDSAGAPERAGTATLRVLQKTQVDSVLLTLAIEVRAGNQPVDKFVDALEVRAGQEVGAGLQTLVAKLADEMAGASSLRERGLTP